MTGYRILALNIT